MFESVISVVNHFRRAVHDVVHRLRDRLQEAAENHRDQDEGDDCGGTSRQQQRACNQNTRTRTDDPDVLERRGVGAHGGGSSSGENQIGYLSMRSEMCVRLLQRSCTHPGCRSCEGDVGACDSSHEHLERSLGQSWTSGRSARVKEQQTWFLTSPAAKAAPEMYAGSSTASFCA